ncbi:MAG TPA: hypothetical protein VFG31_09720 [Conexibacter sp.]|nr:hypothetical protein [Conexibacter sp.]
MFSVPPDGVELATATVGPLAFALGSSVGVQFHPEVDATLAELWIAGGREQLLAHGVEEAALRREVTAAAPGARTRAFDLFDRIARFWRS